MAFETTLLFAGMAAYLAAAIWAVIAEMRGRAFWSPVSALLIAALAVHGAAILLRWDRLGHGPYVDMFEVLSSNVWTLHAAVLLGTWLLPRLRAILPATLPVLQVLVLWLMTVEAVDTTLPVTYETIWLPVHVWVGKVFLGSVILAVGASVVVVVRRLIGETTFPRLPGSEALDEVTFRLVLLSFVFHCLMLVAGAVWAQDAWGRYWAWDPLETWSFLTWLAMAFYLHLRITIRPRPVASAIMVLGIFVIAFTTFFGVPFVSTAPHKGMI